MGRVAKDAPPPHLDRDGLRARLWDDAFAVAVLCDRYGLPAPPEMFYGSPRALRDHVYVSWAAQVFPSRWPGLPDWVAVGRLGFPGVSGARVQARRAAVDA